MQLKWPMRWDLFSLFPAYAGVILEGRNEFQVYDAFPRIRGGDPKAAQGDKSLTVFSPHTRG